MVDQRFKPGDRVVRTGPSMFDVERGSTYEVRAVEADLGVHLRGVAGPFYGYDATLFRLADDPPAPTDDQHPWASDLRKWKLREDDPERHPFWANEYHNLLPNTVEYNGGLRGRRLLKGNYPRKLATWEDKP